jgi:two-component system chemotaxis response regulator CheB
MLSRSPIIDVVGTAFDGDQALELIEKYEPDVVTLDLVMPRGDGLSFLKTQMQRKPIRVVIVSIADENSDKVLEALNLGAIDFVHKPTSLASEKIFEISDELIKKVKSAAGVKLNTLPNNTSRLTNRQIIGSRKNNADIVVIGTSTGGPQALRLIIPQLPADFPVPIAIVLHMPVGYTKMYAEKLNDISQLEVVEARDGEELLAGKVLLAKAGRHFKVDCLSSGRIVAQLDVNPSNTLHIPSVDVLFQSAAELYHKRVLGVVMTGMGADGKQGAAWIKSQGGTILTESETSCVVYGMPRSIDEAGLSDKSAPLDKISQEIMNLV